MYLSEIIRRKPVLSLRTIALNHIRILVKEQALEASRLVNVNPNFLVKSFYHADPKCPS